MHFINFILFFTPVVLVIFLGILISVFLLRFHYKKEYGSNKALYSKVISYSFACSAITFRITGFISYELLMFFTENRYDSQLTGFLYYSIIYLLNVLIFSFIVTRYYKDFPEEVIKIVK